MTLFRQIALVVTTGVFVLLMLTSTENFRRTSDFVAAQMQVSAQDVATTLGIAITTTGSGTDVPALETYFNAMFDSGYYSHIRLVKTDGTVVHEKYRVLSIDNIPDWFVRLVPLTPATGKAQVRQGWVILGTIEVTLHPGLAYAELYSNVQASIAWFAVLFVIILAVLWFDLHVMLRPLKRIREQAEAIQSNRFVRQERIPKTLELKRVVEAMNHMVEKLQRVFTDQEAALADYQKALFTDEMSGLPNRKYLLAQLQQFTSEESTFDGSLIIFKLRNLELLREQHGYAKADALVRAFVEVVERRPDANEHAVFGRMGDDEFALLTPVDEAGADDVVQDIFSRYQDEMDSDFRESCIAAASAALHGSQDLGRVLADVDMALTQSMASSCCEYRRAGNTHLQLPQGKMQWREWFKNRLADQGFFLVGQAVFDREMQKVQREVFIRVNDEAGQLVPAGIFMPMAQALGYDVDIDRAVFKLLSALPAEAHDGTEYALNLSLTFFQRADALAEFHALLDQVKQNGALKLCVEASHQALLAYPDMCREISASVRAAGHRFAIDHLDVHRSLSALQEVQASYVKVNARVLEEMSQDANSGAYKALRSLTATLNIGLYAVGVDAEDLSQHLLELGVDGMQGHLLGEPEELV